ncbi:hypothetical protein C8F04DRAFT_1294979 [Mycena alexandri]|uniref:Uncharacterized protein n=1 Tax=Mycena alexandri TaxID=1745969 RepID=A0AAD6SFQ3_9AGAR|nr:hypothetical protein C8F04DRAFT_1294979 [Mycena alexandri]
MDELNDRKYCHCKPSCGKLLVERTRRDHDRAVLRQVPPGKPRPSVSPVRFVASLRDDSGMSEESTSNPPSPMDVEGQSNSRSPSPMLLENSTASRPASPDREDEEPDVDYLASGSEDELDDEPLPTHTPNNPVLEPDPWSDFDEFQDTNNPLTLDEMADQLDEMLDPAEYLSLNARNTLYKDRNLILTDKDRDNIRAFKLKLVSRMPRTAYNQMVYTFAHKMDLSSEWACFIALPSFLG